MSKKQSSFAFTYSQLIILITLIILILIFQDILITKFNNNFNKKITEAFNQNKKIEIELFVYNYDNKLEKTTEKIDITPSTIYQNAIQALIDRKFDTTIYKSYISPSWILKGITINNNNIFIELEPSDNINISINEKEAMQIKETLYNLNNNLRFCYVIIGDHIEAI